MSEITMEPNMRYLPAKRLHPNDYNPNRMSRDEFAELVEEVRHLGRLPKPVVVRPEASPGGGASGGYQIVDGEHGWRAAKEVGLSEIPCEVVEADDFEAMRQTYKRNQHGTHDRVALGQMFRRMMEDRSLSNRELAKEINVSEGSIRNALLFARAAQLRNRYALGNVQEQWNHDSDYHFRELTTKQARLYVALPESIRDRWLNAGCPNQWGLPEGAAWDHSEDLVYYAKELEASSIATLFERGTWTESAKSAYELLQWRDEHRRLIEDIDAYIRPVVELHPKSPTPVQILNKLPIHDGVPFLSAEEWAEALQVAWEKGDTVFGMLGRLSDVAKLKAGELDLPADNLDDPRVAVMKLEIEQEAPDFIRDADIPLRDKHFLVKSADDYFDARTNTNAKRLSEEERLEIKQTTVGHLDQEHRRYVQEREAYQAFMDNADLGALQQALSGKGPRYPTPPPTAEKAWQHGIRAYHETQRQAEAAKAAAIVNNPEKVVDAMVTKLREAAPKFFGQNLDGKAAYQVLEERLRAMPRPELVLMAAVLLRTPVGAWLEAVKEEKEDCAG